MEIKHKLGKGANYNSNISLSRHADDRFTSFNLLSTVKIVIRGETNTGKTCLFNRLQRKAFIEDHISTEQIQTATIPWDYKGTRGYLSISHVIDSNNGHPIRAVSNDRIKVEVWDVVDHGRSPDFLPLPSLVDQ